MPTETIVEAPRRVEVPKKRFIVNTKQIDKFNIRRTRVELTPAVCDVCGFDIGNHNKLGNWNEMEPATQEAVKRAVKKHQEEFHSKADALIVEEDQLPKTFLGGSSKIKTSKR